MNASEIIESYVAEVAERLPRGRRNDVAFELRALLMEEMTARAEASGRTVDAALAMEMLQAFGAPRDVAARYRPTLTIIDPADGHAFLKATVIGMAIIWCAGLLELWQQVGSGPHVLTLIGQWLGRVVVGSLWWPGVLVMWYAAAARSRRRQLQPLPGWSPTARDRLMGGRSMQVLGILGIALGLAVLVNPTWLLDFFWNGRAAPTAYQALTYTESFRQRQAPLLLALLALNIPLLISAIVIGRWSAALRRTATGLALATTIVMLWTVLDGPVMMTPASDGLARLLMALIAAWMLLDIGYRAFQQVRPTPNLGLRA